MATKWYDNFVWEVRNQTATNMPGWYFADETGGEHGPFATREETVKLILDYAASLAA